MHVVYNYDRTAWFYEWLAAVYSRGRILSSKLAQLEYISPGDRVLYVGGGTGEDALAAAQMGCDVTLLDISYKMLERARARISGANISARFVQGDVTQFAPSDPFDAVAANYFLNIWPEYEVPRVLRRMTSFVRTGGKFMAADFMPTKSNKAEFRVSQRIFWRLSNCFWWTLRLSAYRPMSDFTELFSDLGLDVISVRDFPVFNRAKFGYRSVVALRKSDTGFAG